jgi:pimeloyl-ACP methyl ester carboxylesterase
MAIPSGALNVFHTDFRGHGESELGPMEDLTIETLAHDLAAFLDHLELRDAVVGGISMGAAAALRFAVHYPDRCRALILCRPAWDDGPMSAEAREIFGLLSVFLSAEDWPSSAIRSLADNAVFNAIQAQCPDAAKSLRGQLQTVLDQPQSRERAIARMMTLPFSRGLPDAASSSRLARCPALILAAEGDPIHPFDFARRLAQALPVCQFVRIAPKSALDDRPHIEEVDRAIGEFLRSEMLRQAPSNISSDRWFINPDGSRVA